MQNQKSDSQREGNEGHARRVLDNVEERPPLLDWKDLQVSKMIC